MVFESIRCRHAPRVFIGQERFSETRAEFFFQIKTDKLRARVAIRLKFYNFENYAFHIVAKRYFIVRISQKEGTQIKMRHKIEHFE